jgi:hypothetical protein
MRVISSFSRSIVATATFVAMLLTVQQQFNCDAFLLAPPSTKAVMVVRTHMEDHGTNNAYSNLSSFSLFLVLLLLLCPLDHNEMQQKITPNQFIHTQYGSKSRTMMPPTFSETKSSLIMHGDAIAPTSEVSAILLVDIII